ncbi:MAG TPA: hypothetical protein VMV49_13595 [Candidatus Deferrimicrobium sp.]|nr:hypothetical protein [Candidatus Deferrimicrobium sp.]
MVHILTDLIDWGTAIFAPFYSEPIGGFLPNPPKEITEIPDFRKRQCWFARTYYASLNMKLLEILFGIFAIVSIVLIDYHYLWIILFYFVFLAFQIHLNLRCRSKDNR